MCMLSQILLYKMKQNEQQFTKLKSLSYHNLVKESVLSSVTTFVPPPDIITRLSRRFAGANCYRTSGLHVSILELAAMKECVTC